MFGMNGFHVSASGAIQGHHGPLVSFSHNIFYASNAKFQFFIHIYFVVCNAFNLNQSKTFGKEFYLTMIVKHENDFSCSSIRSKFGLYC